MIDEHIHDAKEHFSRLIDRRFTANAFCSPK